MRGKKNSGPSCAAAALPHLHMPGSGATSQLYAPARPRHSCRYSATISSVVSPLANQADDHGDRDTSTGHTRNATHDLVVDSNPT
jgi:hypothetical protein